MSACPNTAKFFCSVALFVMTLLVWPCMDGLSTQEVWRQSPKCCWTGILCCRLGLYCCWLLRVTDTQPECRRWPRVHVHTGLHGLVCSAGEWIPVLDNSCNGCHVQTQRLALTRYALVRVYKINFSRGDLKLWLPLKSKKQADFD